nr:uracil-DNA glycosylase [Canibacter oris]
MQAGVHPSWLPAFTNCAAELEQVLAAVARERTQALVLPPPGQVFRALRVDPALVRVILLGQDPYPTPGHPTGLAFSVDRAITKLPGSLQNIYKELAADVGVAPAASGDLSAWADQGVLLLNTALTVRAGAGQAGSHAELGWQPVVCAVLQYLAAQHAAGQPLVAVLWGNHAKQFAAELPGVPLVCGVHPSPLSAYRGFFGSRPFSRVNTLLAAQGAAPVNWELAPETLF